jgi:hypothetical protein
MVKKDVIPNLENALENGFSELKTGEENFKLEKGEMEKLETEKFEGTYGLKINAEESRTTFISKPIGATKKTVDTPIEVKVDQEKTVVVEAIEKKEILENPSSKLGDDFDVSW